MQPLGLVGELLGLVELVLLVEPAGVGQHLDRLGLVGLALGLLDVVEQLGRVVLEQPPGAAHRVGLLGRRLGLVELAGVERGPALLDEGIAVGLDRGRLGGRLGGRAGRGLDAAVGEELLGRVVPRRLDRHLEGQGLAGEHLGPGLVAGLEGLAALFDE